MRRFSIKLSDLTFFHLDFHDVVTDADNTTWIALGGANCVSRVWTLVQFSRDASFFVIVILMMRTVNSRIIFGKKLISIVPA